VHLVGFRKLLGELQQVGGRDDLFNTLSSNQSLASPPKSPSTYNDSELRETCLLRGRILAVELASQLGGHQLW
jgi:hypothetical protein